MEDVKAKYGDKITLIGHVEPGWLCAATEDELRDMCRKQIDAYKKVAVLSWLPVVSIRHHWILNMQKLW